MTDVLSPGAVQDNICGEFKKKKKTKMPYNVSEASHSWEWDRFDSLKKTYMEADKATGFWIGLFLTKCHNIKNY